MFDIYSMGRDSSIYSSLKYTYINIVQLILLPIRFCSLVVELHMHTNVYAVYARGCSLSVTCQVVMANTTRELGSGSSDYTGTLIIVVSCTIQQITFCKACALVEDKHYKRTTVPTTRFAKVKLLKSQ